jgi:hypothetical protein
MKNRKATRKLPSLVAQINTANPTQKGVRYGYID